MYLVSVESILTIARILCSQSCILFLRHAGALWLSAVGQTTITKVHYSLNLWLQQSLCNSDVQLSTMQQTPRRINILIRVLHNTNSFACSCADHIKQFFRFILSIFFLLSKYSVIFWSPTTKQDAKFWEGGKLNRSPVTKVVNLHDNLFRTLSQFHLHLSVPKFSTRRSYHCRRCYWYGKKILRVPSRDFSLPDTGSAFVVSPRQQVHPLIHGRHHQPTSVHCWT